MIAKEKEKARQEKVSDEYNKLLKSWKPKFGNKDDIRILKLTKEVTKAEEKVTKSFSVFKKIDGLKGTVIWLINK